MKTLIVLAVLVAAACAIHLSDDEIKAEFEEFKAKHGKTYESDEEEKHRMAIFKENKVKILKHNARFDRGEVTFKLGVNQHADLLSSEFAAKYNGYRMDLVKDRPRTRVHKRSNMLSIWPWGNQVDWRTKGYVTPIKNQGQCGSCWAFSTTGALEGQIFKKTGKLQSLSEQNLVDCSSAYGNEGCNGGLPYQAMEYIKANGGIDSEASYPYTGQDYSSCAYTSSNDVADDTGYVDINQSEDDLKDAVTKIGPISVAIDASADSFQLYASGVYYEPECSTTELDHAVLVVGYGREFLDTDYWLVKNSWGTSWGEEGYIKMSRNRNNNCGIATQACYPTV